jgi:hypothetical protein
MDWTNPAWAQLLNGAPKKYTAPAEKTLFIQIKIPSLRANGQPSKRAVLSRRDDPPSELVECVSRWQWGGNPVEFLAPTLDPCTQFSHGPPSQFFAPAYVPSRLLRKRLVWGNRLWVTLPEAAITNWLPDDTPLAELDVWVADFFKTQAPTFT